MEGRETAADAATKAIVIEYELGRPQEAVWRALTEPALIERWLMAAPDFKPVVGRQFTFQAAPVPGWDGVVRCEVLAVDPPKLLSYSWRGGTNDLKDYGHMLDSVVTWTLNPGQAGGTHLRLVHEGFRPQNLFAFENMSHGWASVGESIERVLGDLD